MYSFCTVILAVCCFHAVSGQKEVNTSAGIIRGQTEFVGDGQVHKFLGIPYAKPPIQNLRFSKPVKPEVFKYPFVADRSRPYCPQVQSADSIWQSLPIASMSDEDCLHLNIFVPERPDKMPVMVFLEGEQFQSGRSDIFDAETLAIKGGIIVVTLNYRLGFLGFFTTGKSTAPGNNGLWDQNLALQWVQDNIQSFGGDPHDVTLVGWSAGATSAALHALSEKSKGLFRRVILQAGSATGPVVINTQAGAVEFAKSIGQKTRCYEQDKPDALSDMVECLRGVQHNPTLLTLRSIRLAQTIPIRGLLKSVWGPVIDGDFIKDDPAKLMANSDYLKSVGFYDLDIMLGIARNEGTQLEYLLFNFINPDDWTSVVQDYGLSSQFVVDSLYPTLVQGRLGRPSMATQEYLKQLYPVGETTTPYQVAFSSYTDSMFAAPMIEFARAHTGSKNGSGKTFMYLFDYSASVGTLEVPHGAELPYVFGLSPLVSQAYVMPVNRDTEDEALSNQVINYWSNFMATGNPNSPKQVPTSWPEYDSETKKYLRFSRSGGSEDEGLASDNVNFWLDCFPTNTDIYPDICPTKPALTSPTSPSNTPPTVSSSKSPTSPEKPTTLPIDQSETTEQPVISPRTAAPSRQPERTLSPTKKPLVVVDDGNNGTGITLSSIYFVLLSVIVAICHSM